MEAKCEKLKNLRLSGDHSAAYDCIIKLTDDPNISQAAAKLLLWSHRPFWWSTIASKSLKLVRRHPRDSNYLRKLYGNSDFMYAYNRNAELLPEDEAMLVERITAQYCATVLESKSLQWIIRGKDDESLGLLNLANISVEHRHAEILLGVPDRQFGVAPSAMLMLFDFFFNTMQFHKLYSFIFLDNPSSIQGTLHLGFKQEGLLREHVFSAKTGEFYDVIQTGILRDEAFCSANIKLAERLLVDSCRT